MTRSSSIESSSSEIMKIRNLVSIRRGSIDRGMATEVKPVKLPETPSSVQTPVSAKAPSETLRRDGLRGRLGRGGSLSAEPRPRGRGGAVLRRNFSMDQGGGVVQVQQRQQQPQPQQQQFAEGGVVVRQRPPAPAPPTRRSYPSASFNNKKYPSITITGPAAVKNRSPSPRGRELLAAVNEIHEQMKRRDKEETGENSETEEKDETEDEFHENQFEKTRRPKGQRACSSPSSNSNAQLASRTLTNGPVHICIRSLRSCDLTSSIWILTNTLSIHIYRGCSDNTSSRNTEHRHKTHVFLWWCWMNPLLLPPIWWCGDVWPHPGLAPPGGQIFQIFKYFKYLAPPNISNICLLHLLFSALCVVFYLMTLICGFQWW